MKYLLRSDTTCFLCETCDYSDHAHCWVIIVTVPSNLTLPCMRIMLCGLQVTFSCIISLSQESANEAALTVLAVCVLNPVSHAWTLSTAIGTQGRSYISSFFYSDFINFISNLKKKKDICDICFVWSLAKSLIPVNLSLNKSHLYHFIFPFPLSSLSLSFI